MRTTASVRNYGRRTVLSATQYQSFLELERLPMAAWKRTSAIGRRIFFPDLAYVRSSSIDTTFRASSNPARSKAVTVPLRDLFPAKKFP